MHTIETFYQGSALGHEARTLPGPVYNQAHLLLQHASQDHVFVPVRSMQYLAVLGAHEIIFVDHHGRREIEFAWQHFQPQVRTCLDEPVPFRYVWYQGQAHETMRRMVQEFATATRILLERDRRAFLQQGSGHPARRIIRFRPVPPA
ncbi:MAG: hypothetical protein KDI44_14755 [Thiothrix sp.]|nr:hypothetical protein [Thiothrix sp.]HPQ94068.1 hypothetical protein [Thiolinea sp.]